MVRTRNASAFAAAVAMVVHCVSAEVQYALLIDAGSSGSRLGMFKLDGNNIEEVKCEKADKPLFETEPGLSSYVSEPAGAGQSLKTMVQAATKYVPPHLQASTKIWVKATAGMRTLDQAGITAVFNSVSDFLKSGDCPFQFESAGIISGDEEALFSYISVNYAKGVLGKSYKETNGILEMGGASMQVIFNAAHDVVNNEQNFYVDGVKQQAYAHSFMFGINGAMDRMFEALAKRAGPTVVEVNNPCRLRGDKDTLQIAGRQVNFVGTGNSAECLDVVKEIMHEDYECLLKPCPMMAVHMSPVSKDAKFFGICNFFHAAANFNLVGWNEEKIVSPGEIKAATAAFCGADMNVEKEARGTNWKYGRNACFLGNLVGEMLHQFGFEDGSQQITFARKYDWKLGSILYDMKYMPKVLPKYETVTLTDGSQGPELPTKPWVWVLFTILVLTLLSATFMLGCACGARRNRSKGYRESSDEDESA